ncbi:MAG: hypothetical protein RL516_1906 [Bacteroidota bacterium]|jgi:hypothetical protein
MKKTPTLLLILGLMFCLTQSSYGQGVDDAYLINAPAQNGITQAVIYITVNDTSNVSSIIVKVGTQDGFSDLFNYTFSYIPLGSLPNGYTYSRVGNVVSCKIGGITENSIYFGEVIIVDTNGLQGSPIKFITN